MTARGRRRLLPAPGRRHIVRLARTHPHAGIQPPEGGVLLQHLPPTQRLSTIENESAARHRIDNNVFISMAAHSDCEYAASGDRAQHLSANSRGATTLGLRPYGRFAGHSRGARLHRRCASGPGCRQSIRLSEGALPPRAFGASQLRLLLASLRGCTCAASAGGPTGATYRCAMPVPPCGPFSQKTTPRSADPLTTILAVRRCCASYEGPVRCDHMGRSLSRFIARLATRYSLLALPTRNVEEPSFFHRRSVI